MELLRSPLNGDELLKINDYIEENKDILFLLPLESYRDLRSFQQSNIDFNTYLANLMVNEKTRAWSYLYSEAKKKRGQYKHPQSAKDIEPKYTSEVLIEKKSKLLPIFLAVAVIIIALLILFSCISGDDSVSNDDLKSNREVIAITSVKGQLKDADSAKFRNMNGMCGEVNSKNSFGAYIGYKRFIGTPDLTIIDGENPQVDQATFNEVWKKMCQ